MHFRRLSALLLISLVSGLASTDKPPRDIVFLLVDDQRQDALSCMGHPFLKTPTADSLVNGGARFANAYVAASLCSPSRASILTGLSAHAHREVDNQSGMPDGLQFFSQGSV